MEVLLLSFPFHRWENRGTIRLSKLPTDTQRTGEWLCFVSPGEFSQLKKQNTGSVNQQHHEVIKQPEAFIWGLGIAIQETEWIDIRIALA